MLRPTFIMARLRLSDGLYDLLDSCLGEDAWQEGSSVTVAFSPTDYRLQLLWSLRSDSLVEKHNSRLPRNTKRSAERIYSFIRLEM